LTRPVVPRRAAYDDIDFALQYYRTEGGASVATDFVDALQAALVRVAGSPSTGSPRFGYELDLPGLRTRRIGGFPYLIFYRDAGDFIDVWRVLHQNRDMARWLADLGDAS
jgi:toxin ParE1/3/4